MKARVCKTSYGSYFEGFPYSFCYHKSIQDAFCNQLGENQDQKFSEIITFLCGSPFSYRYKTLFKILFEIDELIKLP